MMDREHQLPPSCPLSCAVVCTGFWCVSVSVCVYIYVCFVLFETRSHVFQAGLKFILYSWTTLNSFPQEAGDYRCAVPHPVHALHRIKPTHGGQACNSAPIQLFQDSKPYWEDVRNIFYNWQNIYRFAFLLCSVGKAPGLAWRQIWVAFGSSQVWYCDTNSKQHSLAVGAELQVPQPETASHLLLDGWGGCRWITVAIKTNDSAPPPLDNAIRKRQIRLRMVLE